eukprot:1160543-Prorocentrum_minimum.AAC.1
MTDVHNGAEQIGMANTGFGFLAHAWPANATAAKGSSFGAFEVQKGNVDITPAQRTLNGDSDFISSNDTWIAEAFNSSAASAQHAPEPLPQPAGASVKKGPQDKVELAIQKGLLLPSFRTRLCKYYSSKAPCAHGERCQFAHGVAELRVEAAIEQVRAEKSDCGVTYNH